MFASLRLILKILEKIIGCDVLKQNKNNNNNNNNLYNQYNDSRCNNKEVRLCLLISMIIIGSVLRLSIKNKLWKTIILFLQIFYTLDFQKEIYAIVNYQNLTRAKQVLLLVIGLVINILLINRFSKPLIDSL
mgnify:CR=1 FL=1